MGGGGVWEGLGGGGSGRVGWVGAPGGAIWGVRAPQCQALVNQRLPLPPLARPRTIPGLDIGTELVGEGTSSKRLHRQMRYALESG